MTSKSTGEFHIGIGPTDELSLRVSVATLVRVLFEDPQSGELMRALERKATLLEDQKDPTVEIIVQPFGGAIRINDLRLLRDGIAEFHFDSEESRSEQDFRIFIHASNWKAIQRFCLQHLPNTDDHILETDPSREITEEFADALGIQLKPEQYILTPEGNIIEDNPAPTANIHARNHLTVRIYRIFEARILDTSVSHTMIAQSERVSNETLRQLAFEDARNGGRGRANAILTIPMDLLNDVYLARSLEARDLPISFENHQLDESVGAVLQNVHVPKYRRL
jgi:hypothetical protein